MNDGPDVAHASHGPNGTGQPKPWSKPILRETGARKLVEEWQRWRDSWPEFLKAIWPRLDETNRRMLWGPWDRQDINYRTRTDNCMRMLHHHDRSLTMEQIIQAAGCFPLGVGKLRNHASLIRELWPEMIADELKAKAGPDFGETLPFTFFADIKPSLEANDFVEDLLSSGSLVVVYGEPGSGKTFWVLDLALHVAAGRRYRDKEVDQGAVIYLALEGGHGIRNRISAMRAALKMPDNTPLILVQCPVDLCTSDADVPRVIATLKTVAHRTGMPVRMIVVDTLARALGGGNENGPEDMGALVRNSDIIRDQTGALVLYIHHCGKDAARGARGHSSLKGATDTEIEVTGSNGDHLASVTRQRDLPSNGQFPFKLQQIALGTNQRGKPVTSCIVEHTETAAAPARDLHLTDNEKIAMRCFNQALKADGIMATVFDNNTEGLVVREADWRDWFYREGKPGDNQETKQKAFKRVVAALLAKDCIGTRDDFVWPKGGRS